jgi:hypothetical protein
MDIAPLDFLQTIIPLSDDLKRRLDSILKAADFKKKTLLLRGGPGS